MDRRVKYTKKVIKDTFLKLLNEKEIKKITISEICQLADINRATFYHHYLDIYDLLDSIGKDFEEELKNAYIPKIDREKTIFNFSKAMLSVFIKNKELVKILFNTNNNIYSLNNILEVAYEKCRERWTKDIPTISTEEMEYATIFIFNGALGIINYWIQNDFDKNIDELALIIEDLSYYGTKKYIYKK